ncbi:hypothetical protein Cgig2_005182 [Carnegiea gigantea]|uniref:Uncharacterized protein n=1 Tax=Carnegiea gigantea TaxID=171969 RepID=A0A9Q1QHD4_9CARY|nr:hypothetical protein Cgig2_005182 [Carnegiea gigantea]
MHAGYHLGKSRPGMPVPLFASKCSNVIPMDYKDDQSEIAALMKVYILDPLNRKSSQLELFDNAKVATSHGLMYGKQNNYIFCALASGHLGLLSVLVFLILVPFWIMVSIDPDFKDIMEHLIDSQLKGSRLHESVVRCLEKIDHSREAIWQVCFLKGSRNVIFKGQDFHKAIVIFDRSSSPIFICWYTKMRLGCSVDRLVGKKRIEYRIVWLKGRCNIKKKNKIKLIVISND